jgi:hypothetical protein
MVSHLSRPNCSANHAQRLALARAFAQYLDVVKPRAGYAAGHLLVDQALFERVQPERFRA